MLMHPDQFDKIGSMPGAVRLSVNKNIHPHIDAPRKTPIALKDYIKQELDNMVKNKIIRNQGWSSTWSTTRNHNSRMARLNEGFTTGNTVILAIQRWTICQRWYHHEGIKNYSWNPTKKLTWTSYITAIKVLKKHVFKPEMLYTGSELM